MYLFVEKNLVAVYKKNYFTPIEQFKYVFIAQLQCLKKSHLKKMTFLSNKI